MERTTSMRERRGLLGKLHGTFLWFPDCSGCLQTRRRSCCVGMRRAVIKTECYVTLADCAQWRHFDNTYGWFRDDPRNIMFDLSTNGMNPYGNVSTSHSTWPVLLSIMNLPLWLCSKRKYIMLSTLVSGPKQPSDRIDVFLQPLVEDLQLLRQ